MAPDNRAYKPASEPPREQSRSRETSEGERSKYGDRPFLLDQSPEASQGDPLLCFPSDPARQAWRNAYETHPHDPSVEYREPDPVMIMAQPNLSITLLGATTGLVLFALLAWAMFYNWMPPSPRYPGEQKQNPGLLQMIS